MPCAVLRLDQDHWGYLRGIASGGVAHLAVALVGGLAYSHHTALFLHAGSPSTFLALVLFARIAPRFTQSLTNEAFLLLLWQAVYGTSLLTQVLLWHFAE